MSRFNKKIILGTITLVTSEILPFLPQVKGNGLLHTIVDGYIYNKNLIETAMNRDLDGDGIIGAKKLEKNIIENNHLQSLDFIQNLNPGTNFLLYKTILNNKKIMTVKISIDDE